MESFAHWLYLYTKTDSCPYTSCLWLHQPSCSYHIVSKLALGESPPNERQVPASRQRIVSRNWSRGIPRLTHGDITTNIGLWFDQAMWLPARSSWAALICIREQVEHRSCNMTNIPTATFLQQKILATWIVCMQYLWSWGFWLSPAWQACVPSRSGYDQLAQTWTTCLGTSFRYHYCLIVPVRHTAGYAPCCNATATCHRI